MPRPKSSIPAGTQFSPALFDLPPFLQAIIRHSGDKAAMLQEVWAAPVRLKPPKNIPTRRRASLPLEAAVQYGLLEERTYKATPLARSLAALPADKLYVEFARHILLELGGLRVVLATQQMHADGLPVTGDSLARYLTSQGFFVPEHNTGINTLRMWLARVGLFVEAGKRDLWRVDPVIKEKLVGLSEEAIDLLAGMTDEQKAFALALCRVNPSGWYNAAKVRDNAEDYSGLHLGRQSLTPILEPLRDAGLIEFQSRGTSGGKSAKLRTTAKFHRRLLARFVQITTKTLDPIAMEYYTKRPQDVFADLDHRDATVRGKALEAFAILIMRLLGLRFVAWRYRAKQTSNNEVDVVMAGRFGVVPTWWQVQCKHTDKVDAKIILRECGVTLLTNATHLLILTTGRFTRDAKQTAEDVIAKTGLIIYLLDKDDFEKIKADPASLGAILRNQAEDMVIRRVAKGNGQRNMALDTNAATGAVSQVRHVPSSAKAKTRPRRSRIVRR